MHPRGLTPSLARSGHAPVHVQRAVALAEAVTDAARDDASAARDDAADACAAVRAAFHAERRALEMWDTAHAAERAALDAQHEIQNEALRLMRASFARSEELVREAQRVTAAAAAAHDALDTQLKNVRAVLQTAQECVTGTRHRERELCALRDATRELAFTADPAA